jgi:5-formyltetrahydrofolate cyclo-ligase
MTFRFVAEVADLAEHPLGFHEPAPDAPLAAPGELDVVVVPALAVDPRGHRIGYGAGYYDRALPKHAPPERRVAVAFDFQLVAEVPDTEGDEPVGVVVTDARTIVVDSSGDGAAR